MITGIRRRLNDTTTGTDVRLEWFAAEFRVGAVHDGSAVPLLIRLGSTVAVKADGDAVVLDADAMVEAPDPPREAGRRSRKVPDQGVDDRALDMRDLSRIKRWTPHDATARRRRAACGRNDLPAGSIAADLLAASAYVDETSSASMGASAADEADLSPSGESAYGAAFEAAHKELKRR